MLLRRKPAKIRFRFLTQFSMRWEVGSCVHASRAQQRVRSVRTTTTAQVAVFAFSARYMTSLIPSDSRQLTRVRPLISSPMLPIKTTLPLLFFFIVKLQVLAEFRADPPGVTSVPSVLKISSIIGICSGDARHAMPSYSLYFSISTWSGSFTIRSSMGFSIKKMDTSPGIAVLVIGRLFCLI